LRLKLQGNAKKRLLSILQTEGMLVYVPIVTSICGGRTSFSLYADPKELEGLPKMCNELRPP